MQVVGVYVRSQEVVTRKIGAETLIVPVRSGVGDLGSIYSLNELGSFIWEKLAEASTVEEIASAIAAEYAVTREIAERDADRLLAEMLSADLVEEKRGAASACCLPGAEMASCSSEVVH